MSCGVSFDAHGADDFEMQIHVHVHLYSTCVGGGTGTAQTVPCARAPLPALPTLTYLPPLIRVRASALTYLLTPDVTYGSDLPELLELKQYHAACRLCVGRAF